MARGVSKYAHYQEQANDAGGADTMKLGAAGSTIRDIGSLFEGGSIAGLGEVQLLERFVVRRDGPAFAALVARHGPMVLGVCRRILTDPHDIEDAFQATFLILVRKAGSIRDRDRLAPWLFGVARKVANRARLDRSRRRAREVTGSELVAEAPTFDEHRAELGRALVEEIDRLPDSLRIPVILCCVEGLSYDEAADELGSTEPAIRGRLARARERLRGRLTRKGFAPSLGALGVFFSAEAASSAVPATLMASTTRAAIIFAAGRAATTGTIPVAVAGLTEGVIRTMILTKSKIAATALIACGLAGSTVGVLGQQPASKPDQEPTTVTIPHPGHISPLTRASSSDRLDSLEAKLDRLIQVLEKSAPQTVTTESAAAATTAASAPAVVPDLPPAGVTEIRARTVRGIDETEGRPATRSRGVTAVRGSDLATVPDEVRVGVSRPRAARGVDVTEGRPASRNLGVATVRGFATTRDDSGRLEALEGKLERMESRLNEIERRLGPPPASSDDARSSRTESRTRNSRSSDSSNEDAPPVIPDTESNPFEVAPNPTPSPDARPVPTATIPN
ncbi:RNA polymerase sigma factor [Tundrisphaera lichenicola]|uniref:RNA polymerase sigma factor n=1 Tax=Tundrisphaera lichenicola TaxID=2029860 RepID=UPI003EC11EEA